MSGTYYEAGGAKTPLGAAVIAASLRAFGELGSVLDIGCGDGVVLAALCTSAAELSGVDTSQEAVLLSQGRLPGAHISFGDLENGLAFPESRFDTVVFCDVIEHLRQPVFALEEIFRLLRPGGRMIITTPNANSPVRMIKGDKWFGLADPTHLIFYSRFSLAHLLEHVGFRIIVERVEGMTGTFLDPVLRVAGIGGTILMIVDKPCVVQ